MISVPDTKNRWSTPPSFIDETIASDHSSAGCSLQRGFVATRLSTCTIRRVSLFQSVVAASARWGGRNALSLREMGGVRAGSRNARLELDQRGNDGLRRVE